MAENKRLIQIKVIIGVLAISAIGAFAAGAYFLKLSWETRSWPVVTGVVSGYRVVPVLRAKSISSYAVQVSYQYKVEGRQYEAHQFSTSSDTITSAATSEMKARHEYLNDPAFKAYQAGSALPVYHHPHKHEQAVLKRGSGWLAWGLILLGALFLSGSISEAIKLRKWPY